MFVDTRAVIQCKSDCDIQTDEKMRRILEKKREM